MIDCMAAQLGIDPLEMRRRNVIRAEELPYTMPTGMVYDQMTASETLEQAAEKIGYAELREQQRLWRAEGRLVGIGMSLMVEPTAIAFGWMTTDAATVRIGPNGRVDVAHTWCQPRPEPRDHHRPGRCRRARRRLRAGSRFAGRHRRHAVRAGDRRKPERSDHGQRGSGSRHARFAPE